MTIERRLIHTYTLPPLQRPRGYGGAAIVWHHKLSSLIKKFLDITPRIVAVSIKQFANRDICLIGAYLPCRGTNGGESEFDDALSQLREICMKYHDTHYIMIAADFNVDLMMTTPSSRSKKSSKT